MKQRERMLFIALCVIAVVLLIVTMLVLAGVGVKDKPASTTSARDVRTERPLTSPARR